MRSLRYAKHTPLAWLDGVYGWPCEHTTLHTCLADAGHALAIARDMRVYRIAGVRSGGGRVASRLGVFAGWNNARDIAVALGDMVGGWVVAAQARAGYY